MIVRVQNLKISELWSGVIRMRIKVSQIVSVTIFLMSFLLVTPDLVNAGQKSVPSNPPIGLDSKSGSTDAIFLLGKQYALGDGVGLNLKKAEELFEVAALIDVRYIMLIADFYLEELRIVKRHSYWAIKSVYENLEGYKFTKTKIHCRSFKKEDAEEVRRFANLLAEASVGNLNSYRTARIMFLTTLPRTRIVARNRATECLKALQ